MRRVGLEPDVISYSAVMSSCEKGGELRVVTSAVAVMQSLALELDVISYSAAISACEKSQQWAHALSFLQEMRLSGL